MSELLLFSLLFGIITAIIASNKGRSGCAWFLLGILLGPIALILILIVSRKIIVKDANFPGISDMKVCPYCAETIKYEAIKCRFCGSDLN